jgi:hypothetical protein
LTPPGIMLTARPYNDCDFAKFILFASFPFLKTG